jgi:hypothetical protein
MSMRSEALARDLEERLKVVCGHLNAAHAQLVDVVAEVIEQDAWSGIGVRSPKHWLTWQAGIDPATADKVLRLAAAKLTHPAVTAVFDDGRLSLDQAAVAVTAPVHVDATMAELAPLSTVAQLRIEVRAATPPADPAERATPTESVATWFDRDGRYHLRAELDADRGRVLDGALREARDRLFSDGQHTVTTADALVDVAERALAAVLLDRQNLYRINVFIDPTADLLATWGDGFPVPESIRRLLTCDGTITPTFVAQGRPFSVAPTIKGIPDRIRRLVLARDRKCRVPWCHNTRRLDVHHIVHRQHGGPTELRNLCALCRSCHRQHHLGQLGIAGNAEQPDGITFTDPIGRTLDPAARPRPPTGPPLEPNQPYAHPTGEHLHTRWLTFCPPRKPPSEAA